MSLAVWSSCVTCMLNPLKERKEDFVMEYRPNLAVTFSMEGLCTCGTVWQSTYTVGSACSTSKPSLHSMHYKDFWHECEILQDCIVAVKQWPQLSNGQKKLNKSAFGCILHKYMFCASYVMIYHFASGSVMLYFWGIIGILLTYKDWHISIHVPSSFA